MISVSVCISRWSWSRRVPVADRRWISSYSPLCSASYSTKKIIRKIVIPWFFILKQFHLINSLILIHLFALSHVQPRKLSSFLLKSLIFRLFGQCPKETVFLCWCLPCSPPRFSLSFIIVWEENTVNSWASEGDCQ